MKFCIPPRHFLLLLATIFLITSSYILQLSPLSFLYFFECSLLQLPVMVICAFSLIFFNSSAREFWASSCTSFNKLWMGQTRLQNLCEEELFNGTTATVPPPNKLDSYRPQLFQVLLCVVFSSYYSCCWVLVTVVSSTITFNVREDDVATLVWCMGIDQLMMGNDEPTGLGLVISFCDNGNCFAKSLFLAMWHNFAIFLTTLVDIVASWRAPNSLRDSNVSPK